MEVLPLISFFSQNALLDLNPTAYAARLIASTVLELVKTTAPTVEQIKQILIKSGFTKVRDAALERMWEQANKGADALVNWIKGSKKDPEVSETAAQILASQAPHIGAALDEAAKEPEKRKKAAAKARQGLKQLGEPTAALAGALAEALLDPARRNALAETYEKLLTSEISLVAKAEGKGSIKKVHQKSQGSGVKLTADLHAKGGGTIEDIEQSSSTRR